MKAKPLTPERIMQMSWGYAPPFIIEAALKYHLFDSLSEPPKTASQLAKVVEISEQGDTFSFEEISSWLREAGFKNPRLLQVPAVSPLILATKPQAKAFCSTTEIQGTHRPWRFLLRLERKRQPA